MKYARYVFLWAILPWYQIAFSSSFSSSAVKDEPVLEPIEVVPQDSIKKLAPEHDKVREQYLEANHGKMQGPTLRETLFHYAPLMATNVYKAVTELHDKYGFNGEPVSFNIPMIRNIVIISDPHDINQLFTLEKEEKVKKGFSVEFIKSFLLKEGFAVSERGEAYTKLHDAIAPYFTPRKIADHLLETKVWAKEFMTHLESTKGTTQNMEEETLIFAMGAISKSVLNYKMTIEEAKFLSHQLEIILTFIFQRQMSSPFVAPEFLLNYFHPEYFVAYNNVMEAINKIINYNYTLELPYQTMMQELKKAMFSDHVIQGQAINMFFGGHETTAHWIAMCLHRLSKHNDAYELVQQEVLSLPEDYDLNALKKLPYLNAFINEVLRLDSSINVFSRDTVENIDLRGYKIPKGSTIIISPYGAHRLPKSWQNPMDFDITRFLDNNSNHPKRHLRAYIPFGAGDRSCMGRFFSQQEVLVFLTEYLRQNNFRLESKKECLDPYIVCTTRIEGGVMMDVK